MLLTGSICTLTMYSAYRYYAPPLIIQPYQLSLSHEDTLRVAYIGDSWAYMHQEHNCQIAKLLEDTLSRPVKVYSYGICGLTSKEIYENIFHNNDFKEFLQKRRYEYSFISAGINDTYKKMSTNYFIHSMNGIIQFMLVNNIYPIILEIPDYNIQRSFERQTNTRKVLRFISMFVNRTPLDCKHSYRDAFDEMISKQGYQDKVSIIRYNVWNNNYIDDLHHLYLADGLHLNERGYARLDTVIAQEIISSITTAQNTNHSKSGQCPSWLLKNRVRK